MDLALSDSIYIGVIAALLVVSVLGIALLGAPRTAEEAVNATQDFFVDVGGERSAVEGEGLNTVCLGSGCIPPLDSPSYTPVPEAGWLEPGDLVVSVSVGGEDRAFPLRILKLHGVVNARLGGEPVAVTYSPYSGVSRTFSRRAGGEVFRFEHSGKLYNGNMVMRDRRTGSLWSQFLGSGIKGDMAGTELRRIESHVVRWDIWRRNHPDGKVLSRETGVYDKDRYLDTPYFAYRMSRDVPFQKFESELHPKTVVYGVSVGGGAVAYRESVVKARDAVNGLVGGEPVLLVQDEATGRVMAYSREVNGEVREFRVEGGELLDSRGVGWSMEGESEGGKELEPMELTRGYWFTWRLFHPETELYED